MTRRRGPSRQLDIFADRPILSQNSYVRLPEEALPPVAEMAFDGKTYDAALDQQRLGKQMTAVFDCMKDGRWRTLQEIARITKKPEASISARLRDLRKDRFGGHAVSRRRHPTAEGLFEYQLQVRV